MVNHIRKNSLLTFLVSCFFVCIAATDQELFLQANHAYDAQQFDMALATYQKIERKQVNVWFNMALCYERLQKVPQAWYCLRRVEQALYFPLLPQVQSYKKLMGIRTAPERQNNVTTVQHAMSRMAVRCGLWWLAVLWLCCFVLTIILSLWQWPSRMRVLLLLLMLSMTIVIGYGMYHVQLMARTQYVLVREKTSVYNGPGEQFGKRAEIDAWAEAVLLTTHGAWSKVQYGALSGWISTQKVYDDTQLLV
ncbi:MAG: hypothetical protein WCE21_03485 [Candidatus Babeliales bacterium]